MFNQTNSLQRDTMYSHIGEAYFEPCPTAIKTLRFTRPNWFKRLWIRFDIFCHRLVMYDTLAHQGHADEEVIELRKRIAALKNKLKWKSHYIITHRQLPAQKS